MKYNKIDYYYSNLYDKYNNMSLYQNILDIFNKFNNDTKTIIEIIPAKLITKQIYDYNLTGPFFNEYLSIISQMDSWIKIYEGYQYLYYLDDMVLTVNPDGKQSCSIYKPIYSKYYIYPNFVQKTNEQCPIETIKNKVDYIKKLNINEIINNEIINNEMNNNEIINNDITNKVEILKHNLRLRIYKQIPISINKFPSTTKYNFREKIVFRTYVSEQVIIRFEILRPNECHKTFENLLLTKPETKFVIKVWLKNIKSIQDISKYLEHFLTNQEVIHC